MALLRASRESRNARETRGRLRDERETGSLSGYSAAQLTSRPGLGSMRRAHVYIKLIISSFIYKGGRYSRALFVTIVTARGARAASAIPGNYKLVSLFQNVSESAKFVAFPVSINSGSRRSYGCRHFAPRERLAECAARIPAMTPVRGKGKPR